MSIVSQKVIIESQNEFAKHDFFRTVKGKGFSDQLLLNMSVQYFHLSEGFPAVLALSTANLPTDEVRFPFVSNLWDEHGSGDVEKAHRVEYARFLESLGFTVHRGSIKTAPAGFDNLKIAPNTAAYISGMKNLASDPRSPSMIIGSMAFCEAIAPYQCHILYRALDGYRLDTSKQGLEDDNLLFWLEHAEHDPRHVEEILSAAEELEEFSQSEFDFGVQQSFVLERLFWDGVLSLSF